MVGMLIRRPEDRRRRISSWLLSGTNLGRGLVEPGRLHVPPMAFSRSQVSSFSTATGADGVMWGEFGADLARFNGSARRLPIEGQRTNGIRNPRFEGLVAGSPGTAPSNMFTGVPAGITRTINAAGVEFGLPFWDVRFNGTVTTAGAITAGFAFSTDIVAATGQTWAASVFTRLVAGSFNGTNTRLVIAENTAAGVFVVGGSTNIADPAGFARHTAVRTLSGGATVERVQSSWSADFGLSAVVDFTMRFYAPQLEQGASVSTPIFPPVGAPAAATRGIDNATASLASLGIPPNGACTILWSGVLPQNSPTGVNQMLIQVDDGTDNNRYRIHNVGGGATIVAGRVTGGALLDATSLGSMTAGTAFRVGMSIDGAGRIAASLNGGAVQAVTGGPTSGLTTLRLGANAAGLNAMFGETAYLRSTVALSDADLAARVAALPV